MFREAELLQPNLITARQIITEPVDTLDVKISQCGAASAAEC